MRNIRSKKKLLHLFVNLAFVSVCLLALQACQEVKDPKHTVPVTVMGPDKKPIPGADDILGQGKKIEDAPHKDFIDILNKVELAKKNADQDAKEKGKSPPKKGRIKIKLENGQSLDVEWKRKKGSCRITFTPPGAEKATHIDVSETSDGTKSISVFEEMGKTHYGGSGIFMGKRPGCKNLLWIQYVQRNFVFKDKNGKELEKKQIGPEIDKQIPYKFQTKFNKGSGTLMQDDAGVVWDKQSTKSQKQLTREALDKLKKDAGVVNNKITSAEVTWKFWSYLICTKPHKIIGHYEWGFRVDVTPDDNWPEHIETKDVKKVKWVSGS